MDAHCCAITFTLKINCQREINKKFAYLNVHHTSEGIFNLQNFHIDGNTSRLIHALRLLRGKLNTTKYLFCETVCLERRV